MSTVQIIAAILGSLLIAVTLWQIAKHGVPKSNGSVDGVNSHDLSQGGDGFG